MHHVKYNAVAGGQMALFVWTKTWHHLPLHCLQKFTQSTLALVVCICLTTTKFYHKPRYSLGKALSVFILTQKTCPRLASIYANNLIKSWDFILQQVSWWPRGSLHMGTDNNKRTYCRHFCYSCSRIEYQRNFNRWPRVYIPCLQGITFQYKHNRYYMNKTSSIVMAIPRTLGDSPVRIHR